MSRRMIGYPTGWTLSVLDDPSGAHAAADELRRTGIDDSALVVLTGPDASDGIARLGASTGVAARLRRTMQFMTMDQLPDLHVYELAIERGHSIVGISVADGETRRRAVDVLRRHGGHFINRFGAWATEEIAPWRGRMPDLPQHMQR